MFKDSGSWQRAKIYHHMKSVSKRSTHYRDGIMGAIASQITSLTTANSTVYSGADQRKYQSSASLAFDRWIPRTNGQ